MEGNTKMFSQNKQQGPVKRIQSKQYTVQRRANSQKQSTVQQRVNSQKQQGANSQKQQGANRTVRQRAKYQPTIQQSVANNPRKENLQKLEAVNTLMSLQKNMTPQKPVQASSGGSIFAGIAVGILMALFGIICVIGYYIWYFLTHPMDDLKGIFHL